MIAQKRNDERVNTFSLEEINLEDLPIWILDQAMNQIDCLVVNLSRSGAALMVNKNKIIPDVEFELTMHQIETFAFEGCKLKAEKVWEDAKTILYKKTFGCRFINLSKEVEEKIEFLKHAIQSSHENRLFVRSSIHLLK